MSIIKANTPLKRIGILMLCLPFVFLVLSAIHWNITEKPFYYQKTSYERIPSEEPPKEDGSFWERTDKYHTWYKIDTLCNDAERRVSEKEAKEEGLKFLWSSKCIKETKEDRIKEVYYWESSFNDYLDSIFNNALFHISLFFGFTGIIFVTGILEKIYIWIKTGDWPQRKKKETIKTRKPRPLWLKFAYGFLLAIGWGVLYATMKNLGIILGAFPSGILMLLWLWLFARATGLNMGFK